MHKINIKIINNIFNRIIINLNNIKINKLNPLNIYNRKINTATVMGNLINTLIQMDIQVKTIMIHKIIQIKNNNINNKLIVTEIIINMLQQANIHHNQITKDKVILNKIKHKVILMELINILNQMYIYLNQIIINNNTLLNNKIIHKVTIMQIIKILNKMYNNPNQIIINKLMLIIINK